MLLGSAALPARAASTPKPLAGILDSTVKPTPSNPGPFKSSVTPWSAKNEFELFHVVLFGGNRGVSINLPTLIQVGGTAQILAGALRIYEEQPITFTQPSGIEGRSGAWPDALVPYGATTDVGLRFAGGAWQEVQSTETRRSFPISINGNATRSFLVEIQVPPGTATGLYRGDLVVTATAGRGTVSQTIPVDLHVRSFTLPSTSSLRSNLRLSVDERSAARMETSSGPSVRTRRVSGGGRGSTGASCSTTASAPGSAMPCPSARTGAPTTRRARRASSRRIGR